MTTLSILTYQWTVKDTSCGNESRLAAQKCSIVRIKETKDLEVIKEVDDNFDVYVFSSEPTFWKQKIMSHIEVSPEILEASFLPFDSSKTQIIFLKKMGYKADSILGFYAPPFIEEKACQILGGKRDFPVCPIPSIADLPDQTKKTMEKISDCFQKDELTAFLGITFLNIETGQILQFGWVKT